MTRQPIPAIIEDDECGPNRMPPGSVEKALEALLKALRIGLPYDVMQAGANSRDDPKGITFLSGLPLFL